MVRSRCLHTWDRSEAYPRVGRGVEALVSSGGGPHVEKKAVKKVERVHEGLMVVAALGNEREVISEDAEANGPRSQEANRNAHYDGQ